MQFEAAKIAKQKAKTKAKKKVKVVVKCADKGISVDVKPWVVELSLSAEEPTEWTLDGDAGSVTAWRKHVQLGSYRYKITAECELDGRPVSVVIDPDMDVDE
jgi:hypothetical protein